MEFFTKSKAVKLRGHNDTYLVADDDCQTVRQSRNSSSRRSRWLVELVDGNPQLIRLKSCHGRYLAASSSAFLLGMTGNKVVQVEAGTVSDVFIGWEPVRDGFQVKLKAFGGTFLRANGGTPPWKNSVTHDKPYVGSTRNWVYWDVEAVDVPEDEEVNDYLSMVSGLSSVSDEVGSEIGSPVSTRSAYSPRPSLMSSFKKSAMDMFLNAKAVRLQSCHSKYLTAEENEESVTQDRSGSAKAARWTVEFVDGTDNVIRLKSYYNKYLTASNMPFLLGMTGRKVIQTLPAGRLDSSVEWEPIREGNRVMLRTRYGNFLRANGGLPPWRNSVTHDDQSSNKDRLIWDVHVVEIVPHSPHPKPPIRPEPGHETVITESGSPSTTHSNSSSFGRQESSDSLSYSPPARKVTEGRTIYYQIADDYGNVEEGYEVPFIIFKGKGVSELTQALEDEIGLQDVIVCTRSPLNGQLYPLRLQLPPNNVTMNVVVLDSSSKAAKDMTGR